VVQSYNPWSQDAETIANLHQQTGKPIFNGDGSFAYVHPQRSQLKVKGWWSDVIREVNSKGTTLLETATRNRYSKPLLETATRNRYTMPLHNAAK